MKLINRLKMKLDEAFSESWGNREKIRYKLKNINENFSEGTLSTDIQFFIQTKSGDEIMLLEKFSGPMSDEADVGDVLAETLGKLLENHMEWPK